MTCRERDAALAQQRRKQLDLVLLLEPADRRDLGDAGRRLQRRLDLALVQQPQLAQVARAARDRRARTGRSSPCCWRSGPTVTFASARQLRADRVEPVRDELPDDGAAAAGPARIT